MRLLPFLASSAAVIGLAAPAQADNPDPNFVAALNNAGITFKAGSDITGVGRLECKLMDQGTSEAVVIKGMVDQNPGLTTDGATTFTHIAEQNLCPQHIGGAVTPPPSQPSPPPSNPPIEFPIIPPPPA